MPMTADEQFGRNVDGSKMKNIVLTAIVTGFY